MIKQLVLAFGLILATTVFVSCNDRSAPPCPPATGQFNFGVLRYDSAALEYRLDSVHNRGLVLQFVARQTANNNTAFQLISYAYDTLNDHNNSWMPDTLAIINDSVPKNFSGSATMGNNEITREVLLNTVRDEKGSRFAYDYVQFTPVVEGVFRHVVYMMKTVKDGKETERGLRQMSSPMPPSRNWY